MTAIPASGLVAGPDGRLRCWWHRGLANYLAYHDTEWGRPIDDDRRLFEKLCLEGVQAGLSWLTILRKRENFRLGFADFDIERVAEFGTADVARLLNDAGIVRHRGKIEAAISNARRARDLAAEKGSLAAYVWGFEPDPTERPAEMSYEALRALTTCPSARAMSKDLKQRGWRFVGPTTIYAFMQAMGMVNDHLDGCAIREQAIADRRRFRPPSH